MMMSTENMEKLKAEFEPHDRAREGPNVVWLIPLCADNPSKYGWSVNMERVMKA